MPPFYYNTIPLPRMVGKSCEFAMFFDQVGVCGVECVCQDSGEPPLSNVVNYPLVSLPPQSGFIGNITKPTSCHC